jgi:predicted nucleic acid-binding protein
VAAPSNPAGLIDSDILIDAIRGYPPAIAFLATQHAAGNAQISIISGMELVAGCRDAVELRQVQQFLQRLTVLQLGAVASQSAYSLMTILFLSDGLLIPDALIAATALEHDLPLYTRNVRHFRSVPGLTIIQPY